MTDSDTLNQVLTETNRAPRQSLCVFDLDSTLICVRKRTEKILQSVVTEKQFAHFSSSQLESIKNITVKDTDFRLQDILDRAQVSLDSKQYRLIHDYWTYHFFSNNFLKYDLLYKGVQDYLRRLSRTSNIMYLTGRSRKLMWQGTYEQINKWNFPLKTKDHLIMKPNHFTEDAVYKKIELEQLVQHYKNIWFFENDPVIINHVNMLLPQVQIIFMKSASSGRQSLRKIFPTIGMDYSL